MEKSEKVPELKVFSTTNKSELSLQPLSSEVTVNQIYPANPHYGRFLPSCCMDEDDFHPKSSCQFREVKQDFSWPACSAQHRKPESKDAASASVNRHFHPRDECWPRPAEAREGGVRGESSYWDCGQNQFGTAVPANKGTTR